MGEPINLLELYYCLQRGSSKPKRIAYRTDTRSQYPTLNSFCPPINIRRVQLNSACYVDTSYITNDYTMLPHIARLHLPCRHSTRAPILDHQLKRRAQIQKYQPFRRGDPQLISHFLVTCGANMESEHNLHCLNEKKIDINT